MDEIIDMLVEADALSGAGVTKVTMPGGVERANDVLVEISNPCVKGDRGAAKALLFSYWCGALSILLDGEFEAKEISYKEEENSLTARIARRQVK